MAKFGENRPLQSCRKVVWYCLQKNNLASGTHPSPPFRPHLADRAKNFLNVVGPWAVHVYRLWSESAAACQTYSGKSPKKSIQYRLKAAMLQHFTGSGTCTRKQVRMLYPSLTDYTVSSERVNMTKIHFQDQLMMQQMLTVARWNFSSISCFCYSVSGNKLATVNHIFCILAAHDKFL